MSFIGRALATGHRFIGQASKAARFIGQNLHHVQAGARAVSSFANNPQVAAMANKVGVAPGVMRTIGAVGNTVSNTAGLLPSAAHDIGAAANGAKRTLADLYHQAQK